MAISNAKKKTTRKAAKKTAAKPAVVSAFEDQSTRLQLYVKDKALLKDVKRAALEHDTSLSQLWEDWATAWLSKQK